MDILLDKKHLDFEFTTDEDLLAQLKKYYTVDGYTPKIEIKGEFIHIQLDEAVFHATQSDFQKAMNHCNRHEFDKAEPILRRIVEKMPLHADAYRILAQIHMERQEYEKAIDLNIESLKINPTNIGSLLLMGNIYNRMNDYQTADMYFYKVLEHHPDDILAINNLGATYASRGDYEKSISMFEKVIAKDPTYLNPYYGIALSYMRKGNLDKAFETAVEGMRKGVYRPQDRTTRDELQKLAMSVSARIVERMHYDEIEVEMEKKKISEMTDVPLRIETDNTLPVYARMEYYIARRRNYNRVVFNPTKEYHEHLLMHEFMHLEMAIEASKLGKNKLFGTNTKDFETFYSNFMKKAGRLKGKLASDRLKQFAEQLFSGLALQIFNSPLDMLVEDRIYKNYPTMRPLQLLSLVKIELGNLESIQKSAKSDIPPYIVSLSRILNMVSSMHLKDLYGVNILPHYKGTKQEMETATDLYEEYKAYRDDYKPGEEYDLLQYFLEVIGWDEQTSLIDESECKYPDLFSEVEQPLEEKIDPNSHEENNRAFREQHGDGKDSMETMMMTMYMVGALQYFEGKSQEDIKKTAFEIAMLGMNGITPEKKGYSVPSIPDKSFGGYEMLAYYYVSWALAIPEMLEQLQMPFKEAYASAQEMYKNMKK